MSGSAVNSPVIQGARPVTAGGSGRAKDKKEAPTREGHGRKDGIADKEEAGDGKMVLNRAAAARGKMGSAVDGLGADGIYDAAASGGYPDDRILDGAHDAGPFRNAPTLHPERRDSTGRGDMRGPTTPGSPAKETRAGRQGSPMEGVESTSSTLVSRKGAAATADVPLVEEPPMPSSKKTSSSSHHAHHQPQVPVTPVAHSSSVKRKRGSVDQPHSRNDTHGDAAYTDHHAQSSRSHQASAPSGRGHTSSHHTQAIPKREPGQPVTPTTASHQTHHRRTSSTTTASAMRDQLDSRPEPPPPPRNVPIVNAIDDEEEDDVDPNEPRYCFCDQVSYGQMVGCDDKDCAKEWFHLSCVGLTHPPNKKGKFLFFSRERKRFLT